MTDKLVPKEPAKVSCDVCLKEIPESVAVSSEADEYTQHFCGTECYDKWKDSEKLKQAENDKTKG